jgi:hypothetical protein
MNCPNCHGPTTVQTSYDNKHGRYRTRTCSACDTRFATLSIKGGPEQFQNIINDQPKQDPEPEITPLQLPPFTPAQRLLELYEYLKLKAIWAKADRLVRQDHILLKPTTGYSLEPVKSFFAE